MQCVLPAHCFITVTNRLAQKSQASAEGTQSTFFSYLIAMQNYLQHYYVSSNSMTVQSSLNAFSLLGIPFIHNSFSFGITSFLGQFSKWEPQLFNSAFDPDCVSDKYFLFLTLISCFLTQRKSHQLPTQWGPEPPCLQKCSLSHY